MSEGALRVSRRNSLKKSLKPTLGTLSVSTKMVAAIVSAQCFAGPLDAAEETAFTYDLTLRSPPLAAYGTGLRSRAENSAPRTKNPHGKATGMKERLTEWTPTKSDIRQIEKRLSNRPLQGTPFSKRIRVYSGVIKDHQRYVAGVILLPIWLREGSYQDSWHNERYPDTWPSGSYILPLARLPLRVVENVSSECSYFQIQYNVRTGIMLGMECFGDTKI